MSSLLESYNISVFFKGPTKIVVFLVVQTSFFNHHCRKTSKTFGLSKMLFHLYGGWKWEYWWTIFDTESLSFIFWFMRMSEKKVIVLFLECSPSRYKIYNRSRVDFSVSMQNCKCWWKITAPSLTFIL